MSEFQYYEWQAIDRPLTTEEMDEVDGLSSHMDTVAPNQAIVTYHWGDFKHDPAEVLLRYFDALLYWANWGSRRLVFRFPKGSVDRAQVEPYCVPNWMTLEEKGDYLLLDIEIHSEGWLDWGSEPGDLSALAPLRQQIIDGDYRALYLAWLGAAEMSEEVYEDDREPPVPAGLKELDASLQAFADTFLELNPFLLHAAAAISEPLQPLSEEILADSLAKLPPEECRAYLARVLRNEPQVRAALVNRLSGLAGSAPSQRPAFRDAGGLLATAEHLEREDERRQQEAAERERIRQLDELAGREGAVWGEVEALIAEKKAKAYEQAVARLKALRDLAVYQGRQTEFAARIDEIRRRNRRLYSLMKRLDKAGL